MGALYRRARPATFQAVVGQEHVKEVLENAIRQDRLGHAYLFSGPRGVGKTTVARLLAMAVGCESQLETRPCGECGHCRAVREGRHPDVLEIDAASNNSVDDVRELKERLLLAPVLAPKKVVILDEAHMMSKSAFNALLKTLEEPPPHVLFIFATTEPERLPATIQSRTQHFRFRRLRDDEIVAKLTELARAEGLEVEPQALRLVARVAEGAMRDAESLLERLLALGKARLLLADVEAMLGMPPQDLLDEAVANLLGGDVEAALAVAERLYVSGYAPRTVVRELKSAFRRRLYATPGAEAEAYIRAMLALDEADERLAKDEDRLTLELAVLRAYHVLHPGAPPRPAPAEEKVKPSAAPSAPAKAAEATEEKGPSGLDAAGYKRFLGALKPMHRAFVREARPRLQGKTLVLAFAQTYRFHYERAKAARTSLVGAAKQHLGLEDVEVVLEEDEGDGGEPSPPGKPHPRPEPAPPPPPPEPEPAPPKGEAPSEPGPRAADWLKDPRVQHLTKLFGARLKERGEESLS